MNQPIARFSDNARAHAAKAHANLRASSAWRDIVAVKSVGDASYREESSLDRNIFYLALPAALAEAYELDPAQTEALDILTTAILQIYQFVMTFDHGIDDADPNAMLQALKMYRSAIPMLLSPFEPALHASVLHVLDQHTIATLATVQQERNFDEAPAWGYDQFAKIAVNKARLSHIVPTLINLLAKNELTSTESTVQCAALDHIHIAMQWMDDVQDVARDRHCGQPSWALNQLASWATSAELDLSTVDDSTLRRLVYISGVAEKCAHAAIESFAEALVCLEGLRQPLLIGMVSTLRAAQQENLVLIDKLLVRARQSA